MDITTLKKIGLNDKEIKIYLTLLEHGAISVRSLAEISNINRGTAYDILKRLQDLNLATYFHHDTKQKFVAEDPEKLFNLIKDKEAEIKTTKENIKEIIPELKALQEKGESKPTSKFYEGKSGIKIILEDILESVKSEEEYYVYSATKGSDAVISAFPDFTKQRIKRKIHVKAISLSPGGRLNGLDERKWLPTNNDSATYILIYSGKCAYISSDTKGQPVGVIIENQNIYETQKIIFLELWKKL